MDKGTIRRVALYRKILLWCLRNARVHLRAGELDLSMRWAKWAALLFCDQRCGELVCPELERFLAQVAERLPRPAVGPRRAGPRRWLHVFTEWEAGGHSALALRWIQADPEREVHSIALVEQGQPLPDSVRAAAEATGGQVHVLDKELTPTQRATQLRALAWEQYDVVSLHLHQYDVVTTLAFSVPGGPPVVLTNAADHMFWVGASVADLVLHIRPLAEEWGQEYRGLRHSRQLPIPLPEPPTITTDERAAARQALGLTPETCTLLTIGSEWKFAPIPGYDFTRIAEEVLQACPTAQLLVVGPNPQDARWRTAQERCGGRLRVFPAQPQLQRFHHAADVYLDPIPVGSLTALLEVAARGIPCVLQPRQCPYPLYPEDGALAVLERPEDIPAYLRLVRSLVEDAELRRRQGEALAASVRAYHYGAGWQEHLAAVTAAVPTNHEVIPARPRAPVPEDFTCFWHHFLGQIPIESLLYHWIGYPCRNGWKPRRGRSLWRTVMQECIDLKPKSAIRVLRSILARPPSPPPRTILYVDCGKGYSESHRIDAEGILGQSTFSITFDLSDYRAIRELRWDPVEGSFCRVKLESVRLLGAAEQTITVNLQRVHTNGIRMMDGTYLFATLDPMFFLPVQGEFTALILEGSWLAPLSAREVELEKQLEASRHEFHTRLVAHERDAENLRTELAIRDEQLRSLRLSGNTWLTSKVDAVSRFLRGQRAG